MQLQPGSRLGPYEITGAIGADGMGEVYRVRYTQLNLVAERAGPGSVTIVQNWPASLGKAR